MHKPTQLTAAIAVLVALAPAQLPAANSAMGSDFAVDRDNVPVHHKNYSPFVGDDYPDRVFWGDTHLHTSYSYDAGLVGNTLGPDEAYRFAKGEQVISATKVRAKLVRPLDWLVVADHAETLGVPVLMAYWQDPDFDPKQRAFYHVRVLEIPTPRWTTYDAAHFNITRPEGVPATQQERAYTSPIWYTPS